jgi:peptidoglycan/xylan/chitin deacetylase (PgdA/CDA1 family)
MSGLRTKLYRFKERIKKTREYSRYGKCVVLLYHRVTKPETDPQLLSVTPQNFDAQLALLKSDYNVLKISDFESLIASGKKFPERAVVITFDDGYADNYLQAMPILEKHHLQGLFYISTSTIDTANEFWWDEVERLILFPGAFADTFDLTIGGTRYVSTKEYPLAKQYLYNSVLPSLRNMSFTDREKNLNDIRNYSSAKIPRETHRALSLSELKKFAASDAVIIGAHTVHHSSLASLPAPEQFSEISESKTYLETHLGQKLSHFSYPFGTRADFNSDSESICRQLQFKFVAANFPRIVTAKTSAMSFPRFIVRDWNADQFKKELDNFFHQ